MHDRRTLVPLSAAIMASTGVCTCPPPRHPHPAAPGLGSGGRRLRSPAGGRRDLPPPLALTHAAQTALPPLPSEVFSWIARNPLKSPESDEGIQGNPSPFSWWVTQQGHPAVHFECGQLLQNNTTTKNRPPSQFNHNSDPTQNHPTKSTPIKSTLPQPTPCQLGLPHSDPKLSELKPLAAIRVLHSRIV